MGVNRAGYGIIDDEAVQEASRQEIIRRYFRYSCEYAMGGVDKETVQRVELLMESLDIGPARPAGRRARARGGARGAHEEQGE